MNQVGYDYATFGNHEFDYGMDVALSLLEKSNAGYLSCNFIDLRTNKTVTDAYAMETYGSLKVAYVGVSTPEQLHQIHPHLLRTKTATSSTASGEGNDGQDLLQCSSGRH